MSHDGHTLPHQYDDRYAGPSHTSFLADTKYDRHLLLPISLLISWESPSKRFTRRAGRENGKDTKIISSTFNFTWFYHVCVFYSIISPPSNCRRCSAISRKKMKKWSEKKASLWKPPENVPSGERGGKKIILQKWRKVPLFLTWFYHFCVFYSIISPSKCPRCFVKSRKKWKNSTKWASFQKWATKGV